MTAVAGQTAYQRLASEPDNRLRIVDALARFIRRLHALSIADCPFDSGHDFRLRRARERIDAGLVDTDDFDEAREGWTAEAVWSALQFLLPLAPDPVVTHGDFSLDNLLVQDGEIVGVIDVGRAGVADRYQDIAILWKCLSEFGDDLQARFLAAYDVGALDEPKLEFHLLLDELF